MCRRWMREPDSPYTHPFLDRSRSVGTRRGRHRGRPELAAPKPCKKTKKPNHKQAIKYYTGCAHASNNGPLRDGEPVGKVKGAQPLIDAITIRPNYEGTVTRSIKVDPTAQVMGLVMGAMYRDKGFLSTTKLSILDNYKFSLDSTVDFTILCTTGKDISMISNQEKEKEVLFLPDTPLSLSSANTYTVIPYVVMLQNKRRVESFAG
jgi:hypothetical protein